MRRAMIRKRILAAVVRLDKLPVWVSFPAGLVGGMLIGVAVMTLRLGPRAALLAMVGFGAALWLGLSAPRPVTPEPPAGARKSRRGSTGEPARDLLV